LCIVAVTVAGSAHWHVVVCTSRALTVVLQVEVSSLIRSLQLELGLEPELLPLQICATPACSFKTRVFSSEIQMCVNASSHLIVVPFVMIASESFTCFPSFFLHETQA
jgi:hypothetical protein